ncbi:anhydro-N-acetylmuramic acid kinase [Halopseudomonas sabulinigri]|uniref:Anhydro-N-acetylmuramic acid kinase n=2 Tax=Halopseudomonas sabulinigri TaxID=472181 RepID=A0A1H1VI78_9GAMM|nr:anhydro-N-acetylmuramic acid kinase [Halopseudomonas sabulinigri]SDS83779.1 anhydro-N-acetylmuramic acid kinase [Halopseudomonas sabulinigri]
MCALYVGIMSGTSLDGIDIALSRFNPDQQQAECLDAICLDIPNELKQQLLSLCASADDELVRAGQAGNHWATLAAAGVNQLLQRNQLNAAAIRAIGSHGQTVRHHPELGFSLQIGAPALLAELTNINVISDFRSRDLAAGGEGAPLVPAFHAWLLSDPQRTRTLINIGGFANLTIMRPGKPPAGFDSGPGNALMDAWIQQHQGLAYDDAGQWARQGSVVPELLQQLLADPYFARRGPKSTGREYFNPRWLDQQLSRYGSSIPAADVQATLLALTAHSIADSVRLTASDSAAVYLCGGGARNTLLLDQLDQLLPEQQVATTQALGADPDWMEAMAFAWLAWRFDERLAGNLPSVTGARGERVLGALYPA